MKKRYLFFLALMLILSLNSLYAFRYYDPQIARWTTVDPADEFISPYTYCVNNPVRYVDPDGAVSFDTNTEQWNIDDGDTFSGISNELGFTMDEMLEVNPQIEDPNKIVAGAVINVPQIERIMAYQWTAMQIGSTDYAKNAKIDNFEKASWKCNKFVADAYMKGAGTSDYPHRRSYWGFGSSAPAGANVLANNSAANIGTFSLTSSPQVGDLAAFGLNGPNGHIMILGLRSNVIGAGEHTVNRRGLSWMNQHGYGTPTYRTYNP